MLRSESNFMGQWTKSTQVSSQGWEQIHAAVNKVETCKCWGVRAISWGSEQSRHTSLFKGESNFMGQGTKSAQASRCDVSSVTHKRGDGKNDVSRPVPREVSSVTHKRGDGEMCVKRHPEERWRQINFNVAEENRRLLLRNICDNASESRFFFQFCFCAMEISVVEWPIVDLLVHLVLLISRTPRKWAALQVGKDWEEQYFEGCCCSFGAWKMFATERHCLCKSIGGEGVLKQKGWEG